jgi:uncharacterized repeat protein (TIGR03803 family)
MASMWWRRCRRPSWTAAGLFVSFLCLRAQPLYAQVPLDVLHTFSRDTPPLTMYGLGPLVQGSDVNFYFGQSGPSDFFRMTTAGSVTLLNKLDTPLNPDLIRAADGELYGTTFSGGLGFGTIVRVSSAGMMTTLYTFQGGSGGRNPRSLIQASDGNFYGSLRGTRPDCSFAEDGGIFRMTPDGIVTILATSLPPAQLMQAADGNLYGVNAAGIFRLSLDGALTLLFRFPRPFDDLYLHPLVQASDGNFYGTSTDSWGAPDASNVFRMTPQGVVTILHSFPIPENIYAVIGAGLTLAPDGNLYGLATAGGAFGRGEVFRITPSSGTYTAVHAFTGWLDGGNPTSSPLTLGADGFLYGTTSNGGAYAQGTIFRMSLDGTLTTLYAVAAGPEGANPRAALVQASDGNFYGTTYYGGLYDHGTIFRTTPSGATTTLYTFTGGQDGGYPMASLIQGSDGNLYGTTSLNGAYNAGTVFQVTTSGVLRTYHAFAGGADGAYPQAELIQGRDGSFYGTTYGGRTFGHGTVFRMAADGAVTILHVFAGDAEGAEPVAGLLQTADGTLYGTASSDGRPYYENYGPCPLLYGTVFSITPTGTFRTLHVFDGTDGRTPASRLVPARDGTLYGTTSGRCESGANIFRMNLDGTVTTLKRDVYSPGLVQAADGNFYGSSHSQLIQITPTGAVAAVHTFAGLGEYGYLVPLIQARDGNLYGAGAGAAYPHGFYAYPLGFLFRVDLAAVPWAPATVNIVSTTGARVRLTWATVPNATSYTVQRGTTIGAETVLAAGVTTTSFIDGATVTGHRYFYTVTAVNGLGESVASYEVSITAGRAVDGDFDGDGKADITVYRSVNGIWYVLGSGTGYTTYNAYQWGVSTDVPVAGDYDSDGRADIAVFRPATSEWYILLSSTDYATYVRYQFGASTDTPVVDDYDGDGTADLAVYRPATGIWYLLLSSTNFSTTVAYQWGVSTDTPVPGDYDGDGKTDIAVYRPASGIWYILMSTKNFRTHVAYQWGLSTDVPIPGDYDGDGKTDVAVYRPASGVWYTLPSTTSFSSAVTYQWGMGNDVPIVGDFDGDGRTDVAVYRPATGIWYVLPSSTPSSGNQTTYGSYQWGISSDIPVPRRP